MLGGHSIMMKNVETPDAYVIRIKQVARLLGYEDLQVLKYSKTQYQIDYIGYCSLLITCVRQLRWQKGF